MKADPTLFYDKKFLELLKGQLQLSPSTLHKIMNPLCGKCLYERGKALMEGRESWRREQ